MKPRTNNTGKGSVIAPRFARFLFPFPAVLFCFLSVFVFPMAELYLGNIDDFNLPFGSLIGSLLLVWGGGAVLFALLVGFLPRRGRIVASCVFFLIGLAAYLQSTFLNGSMTSSTVVHEHYSRSLVVWNLVVWVAFLALGAAAVVFLFRRRMEKKVAIGITAVSLLLLFMQTAGAAIGVATGKPGEKEITVRQLTKVGETTLTEDHNVAVFILDSAAGKYVQEALEKEPGLFDGFDGFTYYPDCLPVYTRTYPSVTYYLTDVHCYFDRPALTWINEAAEESTFLSGMYDNGVRIGVYTVDPPHVGDALHPMLENSLAVDGTIRYDPWLVTRYAFTMSVKRASPYAVKRSLPEYLIALNSRTIQKSDPPSSEAEFLRSLRKTGLSVVPGDGCYRFFHFYGPHPGTTLRADGSSARSHTSEQEAVRGCFVMIREYLLELKRLGVYDKTTVIVTADHGDSLLSGGTDTLDVNRPADMLMLVKPMGKTEGFSVSSVKVSAGDLFATVYDGLGLDPTPYGAPIYEIPDGDRPRTFYYTALYHHTSGEIARLTFSVDGDCRDPDSYHWTGEYYDINYSYQKVSETRFDPALITRP
ncbi:MAG: hypothetical protein J5958_05235 [Clostridia bacterium]|nr:hypothetical protein [Clostridia bacterium]